MKKETAKKINTKKTFKPAFIVDLTDCIDSFETLVAFAIAKMAYAGVTDHETRSLILASLNAVVPVNGMIYREDRYLYSKYRCLHIEKADMNAFEKKPNIFKRFWNWLTRK